MGAHLLPLDEATTRLRPSRRRYLGVHPIAVSSIVGTDSRSGDFDRDFHALRPHVRERRRRVAEAFPDGDFPPIVVEKLGDAYFVIDGHHRVAVARARRMATIDAEVTELTARWHLSADPDCLEFVHAEQERIFMVESGLANVRPELRLRFTRPLGYRQLLETIQLHGYRLMLDAHRPLPRGEIALDWYSRVYLPALEFVDCELFDVVCPHATASDRFLWLNEQQRELSLDHGDQQLTDVVRLASEQIAQRRRGVRARLRRAEPSCAASGRRRSRRS
jgi:ParB/Sulfiredoxin domain